MAQQKLRLCFVKFVKQREVCAVVGVTKINTVLENVEPDIVQEFDLTWDWTPTLGVISRELIVSNTVARRKQIKKNVGDMLRQKPVGDKG